MLTARQKKLIIEKIKRHDTDTGSEEVQISLLTKRIEELQNHVKKHAKDFSSRRSLVMLVAKRRRLTSYLKHQKEEIFNKIKTAIKA